MLFCIPLFPLSRKSHSKAQFHPGYPKTRLFFVVIVVDDLIENDTQLMVMARIPKSIIINIHTYNRRQITRISWNAAKDFITIDAQ